MFNKIGHRSWCKSQPWDCHQRQVCGCACLPIHRSSPTWCLDPEVDLPVSPRSTAHVSEGKPSPRLALLASRPRTRDECEETSCGKMRRRHHVDRRSASSGQRRSVANILHKCDSIRCLVPNTPAVHKKSKSCTGPVHRQEALDTYASTAF